MVLSWVSVMHHGVTSTITNAPGQRLPTPRALTATNSFVSSAVSGLISLDSGAIMEAASPLTSARTCDQRRPTDGRWPAGARNLGMQRCLNNEFLIRGIGHVHPCHAKPLTQILGLAVLDVPNGTQPDARDAAT